MDSAAANQPREIERASSPQTPPAPGVPLRRPIGEIFVDLGYVTAAQLEAALVEQRRTGARIGEILVAQGSLTRIDLAGALAEHWEPVIPESEVDRRSTSGPAARADAGVPRIEPARGSRTRQRSLVPRARVTDWDPERAVEPEAEALAGSDELREEVATLSRSLEDMRGARVGDALATGARLATIEAAIATLAGGGAAVSEEVGRNLAAQVEALLEETAALRARVDELEEEASRLRSDDA